MENSPSPFLSFSSISLSDPVIRGSLAKSEVTLNSLNGNMSRFTLMIKYEDEKGENHLPLLRIAFCMPLLNYGLFSDKLVLNFPIAESDLSLLEELNLIFSRDIYVNKILRRRANYILPEYIPGQDSPPAHDAEHHAEIVPADAHPDQVLAQGFDEKSCGVLSSGGKESLLTYALLREAGADVHPLYVNESGGHWRTALPAYRYHRETEPKTQRIWTNVDRFYSFMLDQLPFIRPGHRKIRADTYPIRLCIFPFYVFALLPIYAENGIGNLLIGSEFDDLRSPPVFQGIPHYFGIYDQHQDFDIRMKEWYIKRMSGLSQWSAVRSISGLIVERILVSRYPQIAECQRSCHSCHIENDGIVPCGTCSKCLGVLLFLTANNTNPEIMKYRRKDIAAFRNKGDFSFLRIDQDEKDHTFFLIKDSRSFPPGKYVDHIERIHIDNRTADIRLIPGAFRKKLTAILESYTSGYCRLEKGDWVPAKKPAMT